MAELDDSLPRAEEVEREINQELLDYYAGEKTGWYFVGDNNYLLPSKYFTEASAIHNFECREDDVWIVTFPRSGTTLSQELLWMVMNNFDYEMGQKKLLWERTPFFEMSLFFHEEMKQTFFDENCDDPMKTQIINNISSPAYEELLNNMESPRLIKTHFPICLLPKGVNQKQSKIVYVARNPKDVLPSYFYLMKLWRTSDFTGPFEKFFEHFKRGLVPWGPFWPHVIEGWNHRNDNNVLFLFYEDMMKDMKEAIFKVASFLSIPVTEEQVGSLVDHLEIRNFSNNPSVNCDGLKDVGILYPDGESFIRKGKKRERPKDMTTEIVNEMDEWIEEYYEITDLRFPIYH